MVILATVYFLNFIHVQIIFRILYNNYLYFMFIVEIIYYVIKRIDIDILIFED